MTALRAILPRLALCLGAAPIMLMSACVGPVQAPPPAHAAPARALPPASPPRTSAPTDWHDVPATAGVWQWRREGRQSVARFGDPAQPVFSLTCNLQTGIIGLTRSGVTGAAATMAILTTSVSRVLPARPGGNGTTVAVLAARDPLLDAMAYSRGRFSVQVPGAVSLYLPSWPEVSRVIEDCRQ